MGELFNRSFVLNLGGTRVASETTDGQPNELLKLVFSVERSLTKSANTAEISVHNLAEQTRAKLSEKAIETTLEVGYSGRLTTIFRGKLEAAKNKRTETEWISTFQATDGGKELRQSRVNISFKGGISVHEAFNRVVDSLGLGLGNAKEKMAAGNIRGAFQEFGNGVVLSGNSKQKLTELARAFGYDWSVQDGQVQLLSPTDAIEPGDAIVLNSDTGMVGSPESGEKGIVEVRALLIPQLIPGRVVSLQSRDITGFYRVERVVFSGDTWGQDWYADLELKPR